MRETHAKCTQIDEKLAPDDVARVVARVVERQVNRLDRKQIDALYRGVGRSAYDPVPLLKMVLYQYLKGRQSPAVWYEEAKLNEAMQWLGRGYQPGRRTWYEFRDRLERVVEPLHEQLVQMAIAQGHLDPTVGVQDGTFMAACASRHRMLNQQQLQKRQQLLARVIDGLMEPGEELPKWVPSSESGRLDLARRMETAAEVLDERIAKNAAQTADKRKDPEKIQVSTSDPAAPLLARQAEGLSSALHPAIHGGAANPPDAQLRLPGRHVRCRHAGSDDRQDTRDRGWTLAEGVGRRRLLFDSRSA